MLPVIRNWPREYTFFRNTGTTGKNLFENNLVNLIFFDQELQCDQIEFPPLDDDYFDNLLQELKEIFSRGKYDHNKDVIDKFISFDKAFPVSPHLTERELLIATNKIDNDFTSIHFKPCKKKTSTSSKKKVLN
ncbi:hypothetical protein MXB_2518 [Myxobolus squamalis]|nr:hypothetical protein MXB_2518 [Myxobolus squamalis]